MPSSVRVATWPRLSVGQPSRRTVPSFSSRVTAYVSRLRVIFRISASSVMRSRHRIQRNGAAVATLVVDREGRLQAEPQLSVPGLLDAEGDDAVTSTAIEAIRSAIEALPKTARLQDDSLREAARIAVRRTLHTLRGKKPPTEVHLVRIGGAV